MLLLIQPGDKQEPTNRPEVVVVRVIIDIYLIMTVAQLYLFYENRTIPDFL